MVDHIPAFAPNDEPPSDHPHGRRHRLAARLQAAALPVGLTAAVIIAISLTILSVWLYSSTGANRLDLSRPGFERERSEIRQSEPQHAYDTTSPVTSPAIDEFLTEYDRRLNEINEYAGFANQKVLDDSSLSLEPPQPVQQQ